MAEQGEKEYCNHCNRMVSGNFCSKCGYPREVKRINRQYILSEIGSVLNFEKGFLFTIRELLLRPGMNIQMFILKDRKRLVKPIVFIIVCSLIYSLVQQVMNFEDGYIDFNSYDWKSKVTVFIFQWISQNYGYANILMAVFIALWIKVLYRKYAYNFYEIIVLLCFIMGMNMLIYSVFGALESISNWRVLQIGVNLGFVYTAWAIGQFFDKEKRVNYLKGFLSYLLGMVSFLFLAMVLGAMIDRFIA